MKKKEKKKITAVVEKRGRDRKTAHSSSNRRTPALPISSHQGINLDEVEILLHHNHQSCCCIHFIIIHQPPLSLIPQFPQFHPSNPIPSIPPTRRPPSRGRNRRRRRRRNRHGHSPTRSRRRRMIIIRSTRFFRIIIRFTGFFGI